MGGTFLDREPDFLGQDLVDECVERSRPSISPADPGLLNHRAHENYGVRSAIKSGLERVDS
jgi:hypothetical protein